ncbi:MAG: hypothetical protein ACO1OB_20755 [Archangium sp.]
MTAFALVLVLSATPGEAVDVLVKNWHAQATGDLWSSVAADDLAALMQQLQLPPDPTMQARARCLSDGRKDCGAAPPGRATTRSRSPSPP